LLAINFFYSVLLAKTAYTQQQPAGLNAAVFWAVTIFYLLVVAVGPSYFNNNQWIVQVIVFWCLRLMEVAGWLWTNLQAEPHFFGPPINKGDGEKNRN
jgi:hypothetical protein